MWKEGQWRVDMMVFTLSAVCVPFFIVASCFGMNTMVCACVCVDVCCVLMVMVMVVVVIVVDDD